MALPVDCLDITLSKTDPKLDQLRDMDHGDPEDDYRHKLVNQWLEEGSQADKISLAKFISTSISGWHVYHIVAQFIDGTPVGSNGDWKHLAGELGLDFHTTTRLDNFATPRGVTQYVLSEFIFKNKKSATLGRLLRALHEMNRLDVLYKIAIEIEDFFSSKQEAEGDMGMIGNVVGEADVIKLKDPFYNGRVEEALQGKENIEIVDRKRRVRKTVLLTFAQDGYEMALKVAAKIRSLNLGIGVVILDENIDEIDCCAECIYRWYQEADYIIPILTDGYLRQIVPRSETSGFDDSAEMCLDARYARIIYVMMNEEFCRNNCLNLRIRPIESDSLTRPTGPSILVNPIFRCRKPMTQVERLANVLANAKTRLLIR